MSTRTHTAGPWIALPCGCIVKKTGRFYDRQIAKVPGGCATPHGADISIFPLNLAANARLIAAAPEMLRCLLWMANRCNDFETSEYLGDPLGKLIMETIKKIRGEK